MKKIYYIIFSIIFISNIQGSDISSVIEECMENRYTEANVSFLREKADKGDSMCQHLYGEYLLHMEGRTKDAFDYLAKAADGNSSESLALIQSVVGEDLPIKDSKESFCSKWPNIFEQNIKTISVGQGVFN